MQVNDLSKDVFYFISSYCSIRKVMSRIILKINVFKERKTSITLNSKRAVICKYFKIKYCKSSFNDLFIFFYLFFMFIVVFLL